MLNPPKKSVTSPTKIHGPSSNYHQQLATEAFTMVFGLCASQVQMQRWLVDAVTYPIGTEDIARPKILKSESRVK